MATSQSVCIIGGGVSGSTLAWAFAKANQQHGTTGWDVTLIHEDSTLGGHACSYPVTFNDTTYNLDLGVHMIAPALYANLMCMLNWPEFAAVKESLSPIGLKVSAAFPPQDGEAPYWGNFPEYQDTQLWSSGAADCQIFETLLKDEPDELVPLNVYLADHEKLFQNLQNFESFFLEAFLNILSGIPSSVIGNLYVPEMSLIFNKGLASFTNATDSFRWFSGGAQSFPVAMGAFAKQQLGAAYTDMPNTTVTAVAPTIGGPVTVTYEPTGGGASTPAQFDWVVIAVDQYNAGSLLEGSSLWPYYSNYVGQDVWKLSEGWSYLHTDTNVLAPGLPNPPLETLQYNQCYESQGNAYPYDTYICANAVGLGPSSFSKFPYMLTMYGYDPTKVPPTQPAFPVPAKSDTLVAKQWWHGQWLPSFFWQNKQLFHEAQGLSTNPNTPPRPNQQDTHVFFAGNNLTMDSEEGAILAALGVARYAFNLPAIDLVIGGPNFATAESLWALLFYIGFFNVMFPGLEIGVGQLTKQLLAMERATP